MVAGRARLVANFFSKDDTDNYQFGSGSVYFFLTIQSYREGFVTLKCTILAL